MKRTETETLIDALRTLSRGIQSGIAYSAIAEGADRLAECHRSLVAIRRHQTCVGIPMADASTVYQIADAALRGEPFGPWIHVSEKLPPLKVRVLYYCESEPGDFTECDLGTYTGEQTAGEAVVMDDGDPHDWSPCTHWMRIPKKRSGVSDE